jgi:hypothetical protein
VLSSGHSVTVIGHWRDSDLQQVTKSCLSLSEQSYVPFYEEAHASAGTIHLFVKRHAMRNNMCESASCGKVA